MPLNTCIATKSSTTTLTPTNCYQLLPRFPGIYHRSTLDRAVWAGWPPLRPFSGLPEPETVKKGHQSGLSVVPLSTCTATKSFTTTLTATNYYHAFLESTTDLPGHRSWAGWPPLRPFSGLPEPETVKKGHQSGLSVVLLSTCTATKSSTTTLTPTNCY